MCRIRQLVLDWTAALITAATLVFLLGEAGVARSVAAADTSPEWESQYNRDHPLAGKIWQPSEGRFVDRARLLGELAKSRFALLGEKHDNLDHHRLQALIARNLVDRGQRRAVAFEMFDESQDVAIERYRAAKPRDARTLGDAVGWPKTGWPDWIHYEPIAQTAFDTGAPIVPAALPRAMLRRIAREGVTVLGAARVRGLALDRPPGAGMLAEIRKELIETHCGQLPDRMINPMVNVAVAKDAVMAGALLEVAAQGNGDGVVLIAGAGHVRTDRGVPWHMRRLAPSETVSTVAFIEVDKEHNDPAGYAARFDAEFLPFDFVWFTPRVDLDDPCRKFASQLKRAGRPTRPAEGPE